jgi:hypothetical protein
LFLPGVELDQHENFVLLSTQQTRLTLAVVVLLLTQQTSFDLGSGGTVVHSADQL